MREGNHALAERWRPTSAEPIEERLRWPGTGGTSTICA
jgi:hypothetical protein